MNLRLILASLLTILLSGCDAPEYFLSSGSIMGTTYHVKVVLNETLSEQEELQLAEDIQATLSDVDLELSTYKPDSALSRFNNSEIGSSTAFSRVSYQLMKSAKQLTDKTEGFFDPSIGPLVKAWGFGAEAATSPPGEDVITQLLGQTGLKNVEFLEKDNALRKNGETYIDLSAIAKGHAVDLVAVLLMKHGHQNFMVEVGGEIYAAGRNIEGESWRLGIEAPDFAGRKAYTVAQLSDAAMATSGDYRNFIDGPNGRYSHTINPKTGYPVEADIASVTVVHSTCADADALATGLMAMGAKKALGFAEDHGIAAYFIVRDGPDLVSKSTTHFLPFLLAEH